MKDNREEFESDPNKAASNIRKHKKKNGQGLSFSEAKEVFDDEWAIEEFDETDSFVKKHVYRYDESGALSEVQTYNASNVLCTREIYKNDSLGNPVRISVYAVAEKFGATVNELQSISEFAYKDTSAAK